MFWPNSRSAARKTRPVIYTGEAGTGCVAAHIKGGAWGFISKSDEPEVLLETISSVSHGRVASRYLDIDGSEQ